MLPNLSALADVGVNAPKRAAPIGWPRQSHLPQEILEQILDGATTRQESVLIIYRFTGDAEEVEQNNCVAPLYATLSFDELRASPSAGAKRLLRVFRDKLASIPPESRDPINRSVGYDTRKGFEGLADLLMNNEWPHSLLDERFLSSSALTREAPVSEVAEELTETLNEQVFRKNRTRLARLLENEESYPYPDWIPYNRDVDEWWSEYVRMEVQAEEEAEDYEWPLVDEDRLWDSWEDVKTQHLETWVKQLYSPAGDILMGKIREAKQDLPLFIGRLRFTIEAEHGFYPYLV